MDATPRERQRVTVGEIVVFTITLGLIVAIGMPALHRLTTARSRNYCANNLKGIATGLYTYANDSVEWWPIVPHAPATQPGVGEVTYAPNKIGTHRGDAQAGISGETSTLDTEMSTTRNLWFLVAAKMAGSGTFVCPSTSDEPVVGDSRVDRPGFYSYYREPRHSRFWDFEKYTQVSYGYQVPYGLKAKPTSDADQRMVFAADKGPFGAALEGGRRNPGRPSANVDKLQGNSNPWNSPNHGGDGQNVLFADGHVSFEVTPTAGINRDNVYTRWADGTGATALSRVSGTPPTGRETPFGVTDSLIYP